MVSYAIVVVAFIVAAAMYASADRVSTQCTVIDQQVTQKTCYHQYCTSGSTTTGSTRTCRNRPYSCCESTYLVVYPVVLVNGSEPAIFTTNIPVESCRLSHAINSTAECYYKVGAEGNVRWSSSSGGSGLSGPEIAGIVVGSIIGVAALLIIIGVVVVFVIVIGGAASSR